MSAFTGLFRFVVGGAAGTAVGLSVGSLLAPRKGAEFQQDVHRRIAETKAAGDEAERETIAELRERFRRKVGDETAFTDVPRTEGIS